MKNRKIIKPVLCAFIIFLALSTLLIFWLFGKTGTNEVLKEIPSPDGKYKIVTFVRNGGATVDWSPQVSILRKNRSLSDRNTGNIFIGYHSRNIEAYWKDNNHIVIIHNCTESDVFKKNQNYDHISIQYQKTSGHK